MGTKQGAAPGPFKQVVSAGTTHSRAPGEVWGQEPCGRVPAPASFWGLDTAPAVWYNDYMIQTTAEISEAIDRLRSVTGPAAFPHAALEIAMRHLPDRRTILHSLRVATRAAKRYAGDCDDARHSLASIGLLHDVLEDSPDPLAAAMEVAMLPLRGQRGTEAVRLLTRTERDTDASYFTRMSAGHNILAFLVKIEDILDNLRDAPGVFPPARMAKFAIKAALYGMPLVKVYAPKLEDTFRQAIFDAVKVRP